MNNCLSPADPSLATLVIFCKRPLLGQGKSRLAQKTGAKKAYLIAIELLNCALEDAANWPGNVVFTISNEKDIKWANDLMIGRRSVIAQVSGNLGDRINHIDTTLRALGHNKLAFIGTDAPMLTNQHYADVAQALEQHDFAFSQADDGGVGIMANASPWPNLSLLPWSTSDLAKSLVNQCMQVSDKIMFVKPSYDIDEEVDLSKTLIDLADDPRHSRIQLCKVITSIFSKTESHANAR